MLLVLINSLKRADYNIKIVDFEKTIPAHDKYTTTP